MSKTYTKRPIQRFQAVKPENINDNVEATIQQVNGNLNANNFPVSSLHFDKFAAPTYQDQTSNGNLVLSYEGATQNYHRVKRWNVQQGGLDVWTPLHSIDLQTDNWSSGWNKLVDYGSFDYTYLDFDAQEGMLVGCALIDFMHGYDRIVYQQDETTFRIFYGFDWTTQWAVFVNDTKVAETSWVYAQRITCNLPFKVPVGSQKVKIDLRWRATTSDAVNTNYQGNPSRPIDIYGAELWVRNVKR